MPLGFANLKLCFPQGRQLPPAPSSGVAKGTNEVPMIYVEENPVMAQALVKPENSKAGHGDPDGGPLREGPCLGLETKQEGLWGSPSLACKFRGSPKKPAGYLAILSWCVRKNGTSVLRKHRAQCGLISRVLMDSSVTVRAGGRGGVVPAFLQVQNREFLLSKGVPKPELLTQENSLGSRDGRTSSFWAGSQGGVRHSSRLRPCLGLQAKRRCCAKPGTHITSDGNR